MGFDLLDFCRVNACDDCRSRGVETPQHVNPLAAESAGWGEMYLSLIKKKVVWMYFVSMLAYVGCEQGTADWMSQFLSQYHGLDPHTTGAAAGLVLGLDDSRVSGRDAAVKDV